MTGPGLAVRGGSGVYIRWEVIIPTGLAFLGLYTQLAEVPVAGGVQADPDLQ